MLKKRLLATLLLAYTLTAVPLVAAQESPASEIDEIAKLEALRTNIESDNAAQGGDEKDVLTAFVQRARRELKFGKQLDELAQDPAIVSNAETKRRIITLAQTQFAIIDTAIKQTFSRMDAIRAERATAPDADQLEYEFPLRDYDDLLSDLLHEQLRNIGRSIELGLDVAKRRAALDKLLFERAERQAGRLEITRERIDATRERLKAAQEDQQGALEKELATLEERRQRIKLGFGATIDLLRERGHDVSRYAQVLIRTTGEVSGNILDSRVLLGLFNDWLLATKEAVKESGPGWIFKIFFFLFILAIFKLLAGVAGRVTRRAVSHSKTQFSGLLQNFFVKLASNLVFIFGFLLALSQIGIEVGPVLAGFGVAGLIIGFALQDTLSNFASGMMILIYRPYDIGDVVEAGGVSGKVNQMNLVSTTILTFDNQKLVVPNNKIWGDVIRNVNAAPTRRVDLKFGIGYDDDIATAESVLKAIIAEHELVLQDPEPTIKLHTLGESSVDFIVRPWVNAADYWAVYWDVTRAVKERFDAAGVSIPYPQRDVHLYRETAD